VALTKRVVGGEGRPSRAMAAAWTTSSSNESHLHLN